ncbi:PqqD family protein [Terrabacter sp. MAHUQ-38]|uniref:PqqD family protein n=1 Tax=unclassified Terrabacter TaxID=2630222 RepID=UPI00165DC14A|nr:PqqD family protein [Terrabacter sp. MAHUQ-38]MBC9821902.1 PqqD family protein [Terrabacter sp. MAHUQ-38]
MTSAFRPGSHTGVTVSDDGQTVYLAHLPAGPILVLEGAAAVIWDEGTTAPAEGWVERVAASVGEPSAAIWADVEAFVSDLRERRLIEDGPPDA